MVRKALLLTAACLSVADVAPRPHIFMVLVDDWGWNDVGYHKDNNWERHREARTPNIDKLVAEGINLDRHYTYSWCAPTRSSLQSGRLPLHVSFTWDEPEAHNPDDPVSGFQGIPRNMTGIAAKLRSAGYRTHMTGKWDAGMATWDHTPMGRGYETFFGYYHHANDYWNETLTSGTTIHEQPCHGVDLWDTDGPAHGRNNTKYEEEMFMENTLDILDKHDPSEPLFMFHSFHVVHTPLQVPETYENMFKHLHNQDHRKYAAMVHYMDDVMGKFVEKLKDKGMWANTVMVVSSDNGGPIYSVPSLPGTNFKGGMRGGASNLPLKGGKMADWEGGIRTNAFVSGGFLPASQHGLVLEDYFHISDWYTTFCHLAGVDPFDDRGAAADLPPVDGVNQWPLLSGEAEPSSGNRSEIHVSQMTLIQGPYKLLTGSAEYFENKHYRFGNPFPLPFVVEAGYWNGYGLASTVNTVLTLLRKYCKHGCLYNIMDDPTEKEDLVRKHPKEYTAIRDRMMARLEELNKGVFRPDRGEADNDAVCASVDAYGGFYGPWIDLPASSSAARLTLV